MVRVGPASSDAFVSAARAPGPLRGGGPRAGSPARARAGTRRGDAAAGGARGGPAVTHGRAGAAGCVRSRERRRGDGHQSVWGPWSRAGTSSPAPMSRRSSPRRHSRAKPCARSTWRAPAGSTSSRSREASPPAPVPAGWSGRLHLTSCRATTSRRARSAGTGSRRTRRARRSRCGAVAYLARATPALAVRWRGAPAKRPVTASRPPLWPWRRGQGGALFAARASCGPRRRLCQKVPLAPRAPLATRRVVSVIQARMRRPLRRHGSRHGLCMTGP